MPSTWKTSPEDFHKIYLSNTDAFYKAAGSALAKELDAEIVSCDSMQVYKRMNIGTAKPTFEEMTLKVYEAISQYCVLHDMENIDNLIADEVKKIVSDVGVYKNYWFVNDVYSDAIVMQKSLDEMCFFVKSILRG